MKSRAMEITRKYQLLICLLMVLLWLPQGVLGKVPADHGQLTNCASEKYDFSLFWSPKAITMSQATTFYVNITSVVDVTSGTACVTVRVPSCSVVLFNKCVRFDCNEFNHLFRMEICPIMKGDSFNFMQGLNRTMFLQYPIPEDTYVVNITVRNQDGALVICANGSIIVKDPEIDVKELKKVARSKDGSILKKDAQIGVQKQEDGSKEEGHKDDTVIQQGREVSNEMNSEVEREDRIPIQQDTYMSLVDGAQGYLLKKAIVDRETSKNMTLRPGILSDKSRIDAITSKAKSRDARKTYDAFKREITRRLQQHGDEDDLVKTMRELITDQ